ncbi:5L [Yaba monkey tumor virus]|uniref:E3 ubiquitin-protein ligase LAP n=1 Tax=Yaba monkey tumor virus (strain VR587) TaxID=928314 RepID=LAP_YMTV5|nr:5L protein [Yaba monkey tumor virus]Q6TV02.1 RecName: Full=E3 ubiquitin-protein ligase LAP; AltName: Full=Leukemia associated protein; Short=LAP; AltName: Full=RING-type E3 ubiquitin transferase [Yaba monkey tumor virus strain VR587]AAR07367.1 5L [Yaba monkey tumor virus]
MSNICWICNDTCDERNNFCICSEEYKIVHLKCMQSWINYSKKVECDLCKNKYNIKKSYHYFSRWKWCFSDKKTVLSKILFIFFAVGFIFITTSMSSNVASLVTRIDDTFFDVVFLTVYISMILVTVCLCVFVLALAVDFLLDAKEKNSFLTIKEIV